MPSKLLMNILLWVSVLVPVIHSFSLHMISSAKSIYGVKNSGWKSPQWNWGYAVGTGHDCAAICRRQYATRESRQTLVSQLLEPDADPAMRLPQDFEEVKLVLALAWQRGRWDGSDGGEGGYGEVLRLMAEAKRYEDGSEEECSRRLVEDMQDRFPLLVDNVSLELREMRQLLDDDIGGKDIDYARRKCCGLVLDAMDFVDRGL